MKKILIMLSMSVIVLNVFGQINRYGVPVIRNYPTQITGGSEQNWCITKDKSGNLYFGNQEDGVIRYDGTKWTGINIGKNPRVYSLDSDTSGIVYVGAAFEFGYIQPGIKGQPEYISLSSRLDSLSDINVINDIAIQDDNVMFLGHQYLYIYNTTSDSLIKTGLKKFGLTRPLRIAMINRKIIITDNNGGLFEFKGSEVFPLPGGNLFRKKICTFLVPFDSTRTLIGTFNNGLYLYDPQAGTIDSTFIDPKLNDKLKKVMVYAGARLNTDLFAIGTTQELGILVFNKSGELVQQINHDNSAMEDITIYSMYCDYENNSELWISTQGFLTKAYFNYPVTHFNQKHGIETVVNSICEYRGNLFLSSDAGVLKSFVDENNTLNFKVIPGASVQAFPLVRIKVQSGDFLLAGSINGLIQISGDKVINVEKKLYNLPKGQTGGFNAMKILQSSADPSIIYLGLESGGIKILKYDNGRWKYINGIKNIPGYINGMHEKKEGGLWIITEDQNALYNVIFNANDTSVNKYGPEKGIDGLEVKSINNIGDRLYITTTAGILRYDESSDKFVTSDEITGGFSAGKSSSWLFSDNDGDIWYSGVDDRNYEILFRRNEGGISSYTGILKILPDAPLMDIIDSDGRIYMLKSKFIYVVDKSLLQIDSSKVNTQFVKIVAGSDSVIMEGSFYKTSENRKRLPVNTNPASGIPEYVYDMNQITFEWTTPCFTEELLTEYSCILEGYDHDWSKWEGISFGNTMEAQYFREPYTNLPYGSYTFRVKTRTLTGQEGKELNYKFIILKPWYATIWAIIGFIFITFLIIYLIIIAYTRKLKNENLVLEGIVAERTAVVVKQKEELESSIHYASRIQMALLPSESILSENIRNYFILFRPRDIVSGDFYWMTKKDERLYIVAADCTGHGVPGAFMSLLGMSFLDEIIDKDKALRADEILRELRLHVIESLKQVGSENEAKDGMDIALMVVDFGAGKIEFSGAYNPCFKVKKINPDDDKERYSDFSEKKDGTMTNGKYLLETIYASKMPIGISSKMDEGFVFHEWILEKGISYYLFSDGYLDQFGGPDGRKFMKKNFKRLILEVQDYPMEKQKELLEKNLMEWMGESPQIDDILVMGIRV